MKKKKKYEDTTVSYITLCEINGEQPKQGNSKVAQLKRIKNNMDYDRITAQKFKINKVYEKPLQPQSTRKGKYINELKVLIFNLLCKKQEDLLYSNQEDNDLVKMDMTLNEWVILIGLIKPDILFNLIHQTNLKKQFNVNEKNSKDFYDFSSAILDLLKSSVLTAINGLSSICEIKTRYVIYETDKYTSQEILRDATDNETKIILSAEDFVAKTMGYSNRTKAKRKKPKEFYAKVNELLFTQFPSWTKYYKQIKVITSKEVLNRHISDYTSLNIDMSVNQLTPNNIDEIKNQLFKKYRQTLSKKGFPLKNFNDWQTLLEIVFPKLNN